MPKVVHFDLSADDPERAIDFYQSVFGWKIRKLDSPDEYWHIKTGDDDEFGIDGGLVRRVNPSDTTVNIIHIPSVDEFAAKIEAAGGKIIEPKRLIPGAGYLVKCKDTEGNTFGILEIDESAE
jgi:predicted enzyme related to lactoylglutathione lyase